MAAMTVAVAVVIAKEAIECTPNFFDNRKPKKKNEVVNKKPTEEKRCRRWICICDVALCAKRMPTCTLCTFGSCTRSTQKKRLDFFTMQNVAKHSILTVFAFYCRGDAGLWNLWASARPTEGNDCTEKTKIVTLFELRLRHSSTCAFASWPSVRPTLCVNIDKHNQFKIFEKGFLYKRRSVGQTEMFGCVCVRACCWHWSTPSAWTECRRLTSNFDGTRIRADPFAHFGIFQF